MLPAVRRIYYHTRRISFHSRLFPLYHLNTLLLSLLLNFFVSSHGVPHIRLTGEYKGVCFQPLLYRSFQPAVEVFSSHHFMIPVSDLYYLHYKLFQSSHLNMDHSSAFQTQDPSFSYPQAHLSHFPRWNRDTGFACL